MKTATKQKTKKHTFHTNVLVQVFCEIVTASIYPCRYYLLKTSLENLYHVNIARNYINSERV